jgi:predicted nucleic acid-binding protein
MAINYTVQASVVDIRDDAPRATDAFLVDTSVWTWVAYLRATTGANPSGSGKANDYSPYISKALRVRAKLYRCGLSLAELAHLVEKTERSIWEAANPARQPPGCASDTGWMKPKEFRHNFPDERANVVAQTRAAWHVVKGMAQSLDVCVDESVTEAVLVRLQTQPLDGYDLFMVDNMVKAGVVQVLTDDGDFSTVPGIQVFTANRNVISAAFTQGKTFKR